MMADLDSTGGVPQGDEPGDKKPGTRGRTIAIIVLSVLAAILIGIIIWLAGDGEPVTDAHTEPDALGLADAIRHAFSDTDAHPTTTSGASICGLSALTITLGETQGGAGSRFVPIVFTNKGSTPCTLNGYPTVSFVGDGNGTQIGPSAINDSTTAPSLQTVQPGQAVSSLLRVAVAQNFAGCTAVTPDGFRIAPPGSATSAFVAMTSLQACDNQNIQLLTVQAVAPLS